MFELLLESSITGGIIAVLIGIGSMIVAFIQFKRRRAILDTPTYKINSLPVGKCEIKGKARIKDNPLKLPIKKDKVLCYELEIEKYKFDDDGSNWETRYHNTENVEFYCEDDSGKVLVDPKKSSLKLDETNQKYRKSFSVEEIEDLPDDISKIMEEKKLLDVGIDINSDKYRVTMNWLEPGSDVYILGKAQRREGVDSKENAENLVVKYSEEVPFIISNKSEEYLRNSYKWSIPVFFLVGLLFFAGGLYSLLTSLGL